jgi:phosphoadenosine phosphosulfate reductase
VTTNTATADEIAAIEDAAARFEGAEPEEVLRWALDRYGEGITLACSFGDTSGIVLMDMIERLRPGTEVFYLDTDYLFTETYELIERSKQRWANLEIVPVHAMMTPEAQAAEHGAALWERQPDLCCDIRKVQPLHGHLDSKAAWITGLRRDQASTRTDTPAVLWDAKFGLAKINPLVGWDEKQSWAYIFAHNLPYNPLHDQNYPTLGCTNCTVAVAPGDDPRSGRWAGTGKIECGLHSD